MTISEAIARHSPELLDLPGVVGVSRGERDGTPVVQLMVALRSPGLERQWPRVLEGYPVVIVETGEIRKREERGP